jgi:hypothetical protein
LRAVIEACLSQDNSVKRLREDLRLTLSLKINAHHWLRLRQPIPKHPRPETLILQPRPQPRHELTEAFSSEANLDDLKRVLVQD